MADGPALKILTFTCKSVACPGRNHPGLARFAGLLATFSSCLHLFLLCVTAPARRPVLFFSSLEYKLHEDSWALAFLSLASGWSAQWTSGGYGLILLNSCELDGFTVSLPKRRCSWTVCREVTQPSGVFRELDVRLWRPCLSAVCYVEVVFFLSRECSPHQTLNSLAP